MNQEEFTRHLDRAFDKLQEKQTRLKEIHHLDTFEDFALDLSSRRLIFQSPKGETLVFEVSVIGSWAKEPQSYLWGWADGSLEPDVQRDSEKFKGLAVVTGLDLFQQDRLDADENMAVELSVLGVDLIEAQGLYRIPGETFDRYLALVKVIG